MSVFDRTVGAIVDENYIYARALDHLGIDFFNYEDVQLASLCKEKRIDQKRLIRSFYQFDGKSRISFKEMATYPFPLILEYLRYAHNSYIKNHLPYVGRLIDTLDAADPTVQDLKQVFPLFVEDFIHHIYEEEDELFAYVRFLYKMERQPLNFQLYRVWLNFQSISLKDLRHHHVNEDEMAGMRELIDEIVPNDLLTKVILEELRAFDRELLYHAQIENEILFPKAIALEDSFGHKLDHFSKLN